MLLPNSASQLYLESLGQPAIPVIVLPDGRTLRKPRREWTMYQVRWRFLLDSYEGGEVYRMAEYGRDLRGLPIKNLIRHKREYPEVDATLPVTVERPFGTDPAFQAQDDDYQYRLARTPVPTFVPEVIGKHTAGIYEQEITRGADNPARLLEWFADVDGYGTPIDKWMADTVAPLALTLGMIDLCFDHPENLDRSAVLTKADELSKGLGSCVAGFILPTNIPWWRMDRSGKYIELLVCETAGESYRWRYWNREHWALYDARGNPLPPDAPIPTGLDDDTPPSPSRTTKGIAQPHPFGQVPIVRIYDKRRPRCREVGMPRYEAIAELQREYYNRDSELILSDSIQAHPLLQGPEDYINADGTIPLGPGWLLPKKKNTQGGAATYEKFEVVDFPKGAAESIRANKDDLREAVDRKACLVKPAGSGGTDGSTVSQSGVSKRLDHTEGNTLLSEIAGVLERIEREAAKMALVVLGNGKVDPAEVDAIDIQYPRQFDLFTAVELADAWARLQVVLSAAGNAPEAEYEIGTKLLRLLLPGTEDDGLRRLDAELKAFLDAAADRKRQAVQQAGQMAEASDAEDAEDAEDPADQQSEADDEQVAAMPAKLAQVATGTPPPTTKRPDEK